MASLPLPSSSVRSIRAVSVAVSIAALLLVVSATSSAQPVPGPASGKGPVPVPVNPADQRGPVPIPVDPANAQGPIPTPPSDKAMPPIPVIPAVPILTADEKIQAELNDLSQFLETNPKIEEALRADVEKATDAAFLKLNPAWDQHLQQRPNTIRALRVERGFLLHRALARMARTPLLRDEVAKFDAFLDKNPAILRSLERNPRLIRDGTFLTANSALAEFLTAHPALSTALFDSPLTPPGAKGGPRPAKKS
jgi:hypothetical protein